MKIIITTDSKLLHTRLLAILSGIPRLEIVAEGKSIDETLTLNKIYQPDVLILSFHNYDSTAFRKLHYLKSNSDQPVIMVLTGNPNSQYLTKWSEAGADYTFDLAIQFNQMVDVLGEMLDKNLYGLKQVL